MLVSAYTKKRGATSWWWEKDRKSRRRDFSIRPQLTRVATPVVTHAWLFRRGFYLKRCSIEHLFLPPLNQPGRPQPVVTNLRKVLRRFLRKNSQRPPDAAPRCYTHSGNGTVPIGEALERAMHSTLNDPRAATPVVTLGIDAQASILS
jgi:hypothetical protein